MASPEEMLAQDRRFLIDQGQILQHRAEDTANNAAARMQQAQAYADELFDQLMKDGGYTEEEAQNIIQEELIRSGLTTPEEFANNFLTDTEGAAIQGQPQDVWNYFDPESFNANLDKGEQGTRGAIDEMAAGYDAAIDPDALSYQKQAYGDTAGSLEQLKEQALMTPEQQQDMVTAAGISAGTGYRAAKGDLERKARAAGIDPLGTAAMGQEMERNAAADAGDAMTRARIGASDAAADRAFNYFGAEMNDLSRKDEMNIGQEKARLAGQQGLTDTQMRSARDVGTMRADAAQADMNSRLKTGQYLQDTGMQTAKDVDAIQRDTAWKLSTNRQDTAQANQNRRFAQSSNAAAQLGDAYGSVADARKQGEWAGLNYQANKANNANADWNAAQDRQFNVYTGAGQMRGANTGQNLQWQMRPKTWEKVAGMAIGGLGAAASGGLFGGGGKAEGGIITKPTLAIVGENGPEEIRPIYSKLPGLDGNYFDNPLNDPEQPKNEGFNFSGLADVAEGAMGGWQNGISLPTRGGARTGEVSDGLERVGYKYGTTPPFLPRKAGGGYADGGIVTQPTVAMVGENGPEEIRPVNKYGYRKPANEAPKMAGGMYAGASEPYQPPTPQPAVEPQFQTGAEDNSNRLLDAGRAMTWSKQPAVQPPSAPSWGGKMASFAPSWGKQPAVEARPQQNPMQSAPAQEGNPPSLQTRPQYGYRRSPGTRRQRRVGPAPGQPQPPESQPAAAPTTQSYF